MAKNDFPKTETKNAFKALGHAKENKAASARARKAIQALKKLVTEYKKCSVEAVKSAKK